MFIITFIEVSTGSSIWFFKWSWVPVERSSSLKFHFLAILQVHFKLLSVVLSLLIICLEVNFALHLSLWTYILVAIVIFNTSSLIVLLLRTFLLNLLTLNYTIGSQPISNLIFGWLQIDDSWLKVSQLPLSFQSRTIKLWLTTTLFFPFCVVSRNRSFNLVRFVPMHSWI